MTGGGVRAFLDSYEGVFKVSPGGDVTILDPKPLQGEATDRLVNAAVFGKPGEIEAARWLIRELCRLKGIHPASIQPLYEAMGRVEAGGFTTPAMNLRGMAYDMARAAMRAMIRLEAGPVVFELARSEMGYSHQTPSEYAAVTMAAALREGLTGPLFIQGDHFQLDARKFHAGGQSREGELKALRQLVAEAIAAGFYNIDIDASTLVVLERPNVKEQQRDNFEQQADFTLLVRKHQPRGVVVSTGGEIGEVGGKNSTPEEFRVFADSFNEVFGGRADGAPGMSKISVQTGTTHGGVPLPDGTIAEVKIDFECLRTISEIARREYGMAGAVQHGASTLPPEAFGEFPKNGAAEVHLATEFQNMVLDHPEFPADLRKEIYAHLREKCADERRPDMSDEQFYYKTRKRCWGPFKAQTWGLPGRTRETLRAALQSKFEFLYQQLGVAGKASVVARHVRPVEIRVPAPEGLLPG